MKTPPQNNLAKYAELRFSREKLGQALIDKICKWYMNDIQLSDIIRKVNGPLTCERTVNLADVYTVLWNAMFQKTQHIKEERTAPPTTSTPYTTVQVKQRKRYKDFELVISTFPKIYKAWCHGAKKAELDLIGCPKAIDRVIHALQIRANANKEKQEYDFQGQAVEILKYGVEELHEGEGCLVVYYKELPEELRKFVEIVMGSQVNSEISEDAGEELLSTAYLEVEEQKDLQHKEDEEDIEDEKKIEKFPVPCVGTEQLDIPTLDDFLS